MSEWPSGSNSKKIERDVGAVGGVGRGMSGPLRARASEAQLGTLPIRPIEIQLIEIRPIAIRKTMFFGKKISAKNFSPIRVTTEFSF